MVNVIIPTYNRGYIMKYLLPDNLIQCHCLIMRKECYLNIGEFDERFKA